MGNRKDIWIEEVLYSTDGMQQVMPRSAVYEKIRNRVAGYKAAARAIPFTTVSAVAACLLVLMAINFATVTTHKQSFARGDAAQEIARYYDLESNNAYDL
jgi:hypothetical protein